MAVRAANATMPPRPGDPATRAAAVTPHDSNELDPYSRALYVGSGGALAVVMESGDEATFSGVPAGSVLPVRVKVVKSTGTTAANIVSLC